MFSRILLVAAAALFVMPVAPATAQKFKLPSLLPFKKQSQTVKPFALTDQSAGKSGLFSNGPIRNLFSPGKSKKNGGNALSQFNEKSKSFFAKTGESINKFATDTRDSLKKIESPGWDFREPRNWWSHKGSPPDPAMLQRDLGQMQQFSPNSRTPAPQPPPRTARDFQNSPPRHRF